MPKRKRLTALGLTVMLLATIAPRSQAQPAAALAIPCVASGVCIVVGTVIIGGILYYQLRNTRTGYVFNMPTNGNYQNHAYPQVQPGPDPNMRVQDPGNEAGRRETHGAVNRSDCYKMLERFQRQGRRIRLVDVMPNQYNRGGGVLKYICIFEGDDSQAGYYNDRRYR